MRVHKRAHRFVATPSIRQDFVRFFSVGDVMTGEGVSEPLHRASEADAVQGNQGDDVSCVYS